MSTTNTHTAGPWRYEAATNTIRSVPANYWLATMDSWDGAISNDANAKLIAAAPELLAALVDALEALQIVQDLLPTPSLLPAINNANAAIAKATK